MVEVLRARSNSGSLSLLALKTIRVGEVLSPGQPHSLCHKGTDLLTKVKLIRIQITVFKLAGNP